MSDSTRNFGTIAEKLARNPLGIIALFIVLVYGLAALVTTVSSSLTSSERLPLIYFLIGFPVLVLAVFAWLVSRHSTKLFAPGDFRDEENYVRTTLTATASLAVATARSGSSISPAEIEAVVSTVQEATTPSRTPAGGPHRHNHILWVDDRPDNNINERRAFEALGIRFTLAHSTKQALEHVANQRFSTIISDMRREEGPREGYVLLDALRSSGNHTPLFFYASSNAPQHKDETREHGGQGCTNNPQELFQMVMRTVLQR